MKKLYAVGLVIILSLSAAMISYGAWLNKNDKNQIMELIKNSTILLQGVKVKLREINFEIMLETINLYSEETTVVFSPSALVGKSSFLYFSMPINDRYAQRLSIGDCAELSLENNPMQIFSVRVKEISPPLNESATVREIIWEVNNQNGLLKQQVYTGATLKSARTEKVLAVPLKAMTDSNRDTVFVVTADNTLERREVKTGLDDGSRIEILSGLQEDETVITSSTEGLGDGMKVKVTVTGEDDK